MKYVLSTIIVLASATFARSAQDGDVGYVGKWMSQGSPECVSMAEIKADKSVAIAALNHDQFQFVRALYIFIPPQSRVLPPGDSAVVVGASDGSAMIALIGDGKSCARFNAPPFILDMVNKVGAGESGEPTGTPL